MLVASTADSVRAEDKLHKQQLILCNSVAQHPTLFSILSYLDCFIEPAVRRVPLCAAAMDHLQSSVGIVSCAADLSFRRLVFDDVEPINGQRLIDADDHARRLDGLQRAGVD